MRRYIDLLSPLGLLIMLVAAVMARHGYTVKPNLNLYLIVGLALILVHLLVRWEDIYRGIGRRRLRYGTNTAVLVVLVLGILVALNWLAKRHPLKKDFTKNQRYSLSDQTKKVVQGLKDDVRLVYFQRAADMEGPGPDRVKDYAGLSSHVKLEFVDPVTRPQRARELDVKGPWPTVVIEKGDKRERVNNDSEQDLTNAFVKLTREGKKTVCFEEGEGERDIEDSEDGGLSGAKAALGKDQYLTKKVLVAREGKVPADCTVFVVAGPKTDLLPQVVDAITAFVKSGGKALLMQDPEMKEKRPNMDGLLKSFNIEAGNDVVVDVSPFGQMFGTGALTPIAVQYPYHEITRGFRVMTAFNEARSMQAGTATVEGVTAQNVVETSNASWAETDLTLKEPVQPDEGKDKKGPISLGAVATVRVQATPSPAPSPSPAVASPATGASPAAAGASPSPAASAFPSPSPQASPEEPPPPGKEGRLAAFGDSDFASNAFLGFQGNRDFFLNTVAWLAQDADLISIRAKEPEDQRMVLTREQQQNVAILALLLLPGLFVVMGIRAWWVRR